MTRDQTFPALFNLQTQSSLAQYPGELNSAYRDSAQNLWAQLSSAHPSTLAQLGTAQAPAAQLPSAQFWSATQSFLGQNVLLTQTLTPAQLPPAQMSPAQIPPA